MTISVKFSDQQQEMIESPFSGSIFLDGRAGCGKTTASAARLQRLLEMDISGSEVLVMMPARNSSRIYSEIYSQNGSFASITTYSSFIKRSLELFWPVVAPGAGFSSAEKTPVFLTIETAQILMAGLIQSKIDNGYFASLQIPLSRIYNQILVAMHKMAAAEFPFDSYANRMKSSWSGDSSLLSVFDQVQECGILFRTACFENNLLDFSIQVEVFQNILLPDERFREWLSRNYRHFFYDNIEEDTPAAHRFAGTLRDICESSLFIADHLGGFRNFMGSDIRSAFQLADSCDIRRTFNESFICQPEISAMARAVELPAIPTTELPANPQNAFSFQTFHQYPAMVRQAAHDVADLIHNQNVPPSQIAIIAPLVSDVLYTSLERELRIQNITNYMKRASRPLIEEPYTKCFLILMALLHPEWGTTPRMLDICEMFQRFIPGLDPIRGQILVSYSFKKKSDPNTQSEKYDVLPLSAFQQKVNSRLSTDFLACYETFRIWLNKNTSSSEPPDITLTRFFHEILTSKGFAANNGIINPLSSGIQNVIESVRKCRMTIEATDSNLISWKNFMRLVWDGMVSARYNDESSLQPENAVLITLSSTFALANQPVTYQFWLNAGSRRWWERIYGQITNDYVLSQDWQANELWDARKVDQVNNENMLRLVLALLSRCRKQVRGYASELNESGQDQKSKLLYIFSDLSYRFRYDQSSWPVEPPELENPESDSQGFFPGISENRTQTTSKRLETD